MGKVENTFNFRHKQSVRVEENNGYVNEYDQYERNTFHMMPNGYWCLNFFNEPENGKVNPMPYQSVHKYWHKYNNLD